MAKSTPRTRRPREQAEPEAQEQPTTTADKPGPAATAMEAPPARSESRPESREARGDSRAESRETRESRTDRDEIRRDDSRRDDARSDRDTRAERPERTDRPRAESRDDGDARPSGGSSAGDDVASFDAETNAKYEQVKGGKLYIKDLQTMDVHGLLEIARQEVFQDYIGLK